MASLTVEFSNKSNFLDSQVSIGFFAEPGSVTPEITNLKNQSKIEPIEHGTGPYPRAGNWYTLADLSSGAAMSQFSGRVYVCYGSTWSSQRSGYEPGQSVTDPNFYLRYDKMEMTFTGSVYDVADLTSIDYWSIPMTLNVLKDGIVKESALGLKPGVTAQDIYSRLNALTTPPVSGLPGVDGPDGKPLPALVPGDYVAYPGGPTPGTTFARIIGPNSYASIDPQGIPVQPYDLMKNYYSWLNTTFGPGTPTNKVPTLGNGVIATIAGDFVGVGSPPPNTGPQSRQTYDLSATIDRSLNITLTGKLSVSGATTMVYKLKDLVNPAGFYGGNAPFYLNGATTPTTPANDVYGWVGGDLFTGFNIGAIGSSYEVSGRNTDNDRGSFTTGTMVGSMPSHQWFAIASADFYAVMQPDGNYYNQWAATLQPLSNAYNFAYTDRFAHVLVTLDPNKVDTLQIVLEDGTIRQTA